MSESSSVGLPIQLCLVGEATQDDGLVKASYTFGVPVLQSSTGEEHFSTGHLTTVFVLSEFSGPVYDRLALAKQHILGTPALRDLANSKQPVLVEKRPIFSLALEGCCIIFTGYRKKADLERLLKLIHTMGGSVHKDVGKKVTHLIAVNSLGDKYQYATTFSIPVLTEQWLHAAWDNRYQQGFRANNKDDYQKYKLKPFTGNTVCFYGFDPLEVAHMKEVLESNGGRLAEKPDDPSTTHLVVDENNIETLPPELNKDNKCVVVKGDWFWNSIQIEAAAEVANYKWREGGQGLSSPSQGVFSPTTPSSTHASRKRKRLRRAEMIRSLASADSPNGCSAHKRRSSVSEAYLLSTSCSFLDSTEKTILSPEKEAISTSPVIEGVESEPEELKIPTAALTARQQVFHELVTTESNYVEILACICRIAKEAEDTTQLGGALLDQQEANIIFNDVGPIFNVHSEMLKKLREAEKNWKEDFCVGKVIVGFAPELLKAYPTFVNFVERTKQKIAECDRRNPRFHAFLKKCERRPECHRQPLKELMIRPVQRLPSLTLLLTDLLKHTRKEKDHPDVAELEAALAKIKEVLTHINEDKRKTEGQITIFDIYNEIQDCPASIVNSHRSFVCRNDVIEVAATGDTLCGKGYELTLFLFTDILVVAKRKSGSKGLGMMGRSPSTASLAGIKNTQPLQQNKYLKFVTTINLASVRRLVDVVEGDEVDIVALVCLGTEDLREKMYLLQLAATETQDEKTSFLKVVCRHVANTLCRPDPESLLVRMSARDMSLDASDLNVSTFSRTFSSWHRTTQKVGRAFSFNKTPNRLRRAVSTMISPLGSSSGRLPSLTPNESMRDLRLENPGVNTTPRSSRGPGGLQSCVNLMEEVGDSPRSTRSFPARSPNKFAFTVPPESPRRQALPLQSPRKLPMESPRRERMEPVGRENKDPEFRTPTLCSRPSFRDKFRSSSLAGFGKRSQN